MSVKVAALIGHEDGKNRAGNNVFGRKVVKLVIKFKYLIVH